jgi:hypothetical protein
MTSQLNSTVAAAAAAAWIADQHRFAGEHQDSSRPTPRRARSASRWFQRVAWAAGVPAAQAAPAQAFKGM